MAIIALPLFAILTASIDYGWYFATSHVLQNVCYTAARAGAMTPQGSDAAAAATAAAEAKWGALGLPGSITVAVTSTGTPEKVEVTVTKAGPYLVGLVPVPSTASITILRRREEQPLPTP